MSINKFGSAQEIREDKKTSKKIFKETPNFTEDEIEVLKYFKEKCNEKGINSEELINKLRKVWIKPLYYFLPN